LLEHYHNDLQFDESELNLTQKDQDIRTVLDEIGQPEVAIGMQDLAKELTEEDVSTALRESGSGKAAGLDGLPTEFWAKLHEVYLTSKKVTEDRTGRAAAHAEPVKRTFNIIALLTRVYNDIERNSVVPGTEFAKVWMCPIFKKKDVTDIANYRPITFLNTDYKIFTKALTTKLSRVAPHLIHPNQAGFMKGRKISDQMFLAMEMVEYAEDQLEDGAILALGPEKADNKMSHRYLWYVLKHNHIPDMFINTIKSLYSDAETQVVINGVLSSSFRVIQGVRQGDLLSCLLFDLAIEPLASMLRRSDLGLQNKQCNAESGHHTIHR
jgi:hypothetical protein